MLSEAITQSTTNGTWAAVTGLTVIILTQFGKMISDARKDKISMLAEEEKLRTLRDIANTNNSIRVGQIEQNGKLSKAVAVNEAYHNELIRTLSTTCKMQSNKQQTTMKGK